MASKVPGMLTQDELARRVKAGEIDTVLLVFTDHYGLCPVISSRIGRKVTATFTWFPTLQPFGWQAGWKRRRF
jgi:hypothetical protein